MNPFAPTSLLMLDAEIGYRREQTARDLAGARRLFAGWTAHRRTRRLRASADDLTLAA